MRFAVHTGIAAYPQHTCSFENTNPETLIAKPNYKVLGADALRMRLRRLCEKKASGKNVGGPANLRWLQEWGWTQRVARASFVWVFEKMGDRPWPVQKGEGQEFSKTHMFVPVWAIFFTRKNCSLVASRGPLQAEFVTRVVVVRERMSSKEQEVTGKWCTEEKLKSQYAPQPSH